ncbi:metalloregulator ArsR/SmtB family transcription factor [Rhodoferax sp.]|uniref:ArsR/SmtB family transcription factor n=1 Tax=Rhodoferax sp. TaxID=50421 RepID=UPI002ABB04F0|nr:metalloregulator ArsR/SmtB family transcription factor [Rhodoferax sp.]MDZ4207502.1 metalloregulator ArsR/SmtB family transcription factor [Rhodoferax sp.]
MEEAAVVQALGALAQETRLKIFRLLVVAGPSGLTPGRMSDALGTPPTALSFHLKELSHAGLVLCERDGRHLIYRAAIPLMNDLLGFLTAHCCQGLPCLDTPAPLDCKTC